MHVDNCILNAETLVCVKEPPAYTFRDYRCVQGQVPQGRQCPTFSPYPWTCTQTHKLGQLFLKPTTSSHRPLDRKPLNEKLVTVV